MLSGVSVARSSGRKGRPWRRIRAQVLATSTVCWLCGHEGAGDIDHDPPRSELLARGLNPEDPQYLRPAHGAYSRCPTCGRCCNQVRGNRDHIPPRTTSRAW
jgi:hypothetical protein